MVKSRIVMVILGMACENWVYHMIIYSNIFQPQQWMMQWLPKKTHPAPEPQIPRVVLLLSFRLQRFCCATTCFIFHLEVKTHWASH